MKFDLTQEQQRARETARDFARREIAPGAAERDRSARWPAEIVARLGEVGFLGMAVPAELGGAGFSHVASALVVEEISAACAGAGAITGVHNALFCEPLLRFGTPWQQREILAPAAAGKAIGCFAMGGPRTVAEKQDDGSFVLDGSERFVTLGPEAEHAVVVAATPAPTGEIRHTALLVHRGVSGYQRSPRDERLGLRAAPTCTLSFEGVRVPASHVLGGEGGGAAVALVARDGARTGIAAQAIGIARAALDEAAAFAKEHGTAGVQSIQFMLSDMAVDIDAARLLTLRAALLQDAGAPHAAESAMAKLFAAEMATRVTHRAVQIFGGSGLTTEHGVERHYRDARITEIDEGTSEIQRILIAASVLEG